MLGGACGNRKAVLPSVGCDAVWYAWEGECRMGVSPCLTDLLLALERGAHDRCSELFDCLADKMMFSCERNAALLGYIEVYM